MLQLLQMIGSGSAKKLYADDVFSTYLYTGNGSTQTINNGIGGDRTVWTKSRSNATAGLIYCTAQGGGKYLVPSSTNGLNSSYPNTLTAFNLNSFSLGADDNSNASGSSSVAWTFADAPKFHAHDVVTKSAGSHAIINFLELETLGMVRVKRTDAAGSWYVWHRSLSAGKLLIGETTAAETPLGHITVSGTTVTLVNGVIADGTYLVEAFAHDASAEGLIQCGCVINAAGGVAEVALGFEPQYVLIKQSNGADNWYVLDSMRGMPATDGAAQRLSANSASPETTGYAAKVTASGFVLQGTDGGSYIYIAIRRPNKPPTTGAEVYNASTASGVVSAGFPVDLHIGATRAGAANNHAVHARLIGGTKELVTSSTASEATITDLGFDSMTGLRASLAAGGVNHFFKRAAGFMDVVCYNGTGVAHPEPHNLGVVPELMITKVRNEALFDWYTLVSPFTSGHLMLDLANAKSTFDIVGANPTPSVFTVTNATINKNGNNYVAYLFATLAGVSKVSTYTGNGSTQTIDCGFSAGARLVLIKRTDSAGDWYIWNSSTGIVAANDPHLSLNTTAAEVTTDDSLDPHPSGFIVLQNAATNINVLNATYLFLSIS